MQTCHRRLSGLIAIALSIVAFQGLLSEDAIATPQAGDLITTGQDYSAAYGAVLCVNPVSGSIAIISSAGLMRFARGLDVSPSGEIYVTADGRPGEFVGLIEVNPKTGEQTIVSEGGLMIRPRAVAIDHDGMVLVTDFGSGVIRIDPNSGTQTLIASGGMLRTPSGIAVENDGSILVTSASVDAGDAGIVRIDPSDGSQSLLTQGDTGEDYLGLGISESGVIFLGNSIGGSAEILDIHSVTGAKTNIAGGQPLDWVYDIAVSTDGALYVSNVDHPGFGYVVKVDPANGAKTIIAQTLSNGLLGVVSGIAIYPDTSVQTVPTTWGEIKASRR